jgi:long-chain acyl-CoA synthetase
MALDLELYRLRIHLPSSPPIALSVIDIAPEHPSKTIIFLHGYGGQARQWEYQLDEFSISDRVIAIDQRGHGQSDKPDGDYSMTQLVEDLHMVLEELKVEENFLLVGHSFGGAIATEYAVAYPEQVKHLILIATAGEFQLNPFYRFLLNLPRSLLRSLGPIVQGWLSAPPKVMHAWYHQNVAKWNGWSLFRSLKVPTTVIRGHSDVVFSKAMFDEVARAIPDADDIDVGASGHLVMLERRRAVNRAIKRSLESESRSWSLVSEEFPSSNGVSLLGERPWLTHYDEGIPYTIAIPNISLHQLLRSARSRFPRHAALLFEGRRITYSQLLEEVFRMANALASLGISPGDRVMLLLPNLPQMVISYFAILELGAVAVFSHPITAEDEFIRQLELTQSKVIITLRMFEKIIERLIAEENSSALSSLSDIILTNPYDYLPYYKKVLLRYKDRRRGGNNQAKFSRITPHEFTGFISQHGKTSLDNDIAPDSLATIQFTGGTTAVPKGVMLSHRNLVVNAIQTRHWMPNAVEGKERFLCVLPFSHSYGLTTALNLPVAIGATLVIKPKFETLDILKTIKKYHPTVFPGVPSMYMAIKDFPGVRKYGISSINACISGSAPLPIEVQEAFEKLTRGKLVEGYGLTEAGPATHGNPLYGQRKVGSIGIPFPSTEARVVDLQKGKKEVNVGQIGELAVRGPQVMLGYWEDPRSTRKAFNSDGFLLTGDVAQMDSEGYFRIISRKADMWYPDKPGKPAFPRDVEEVLFEIPQISDAAVVAIANQPIAFVITKGERPAGIEIIAFCKRRLPPNQVPRFVIFVEDFPRTFIGKILRRELATKFEQSQLEHERELESQPELEDSNINPNNSILP